MKTSQSTTPIRELMPDKFLPKIIARVRSRTGKTPQRATISDVILGERLGSKYWPYIAELAKEKNPVAYEERIAHLQELQQQFENAA